MLLLLELPWCGTFRSKLVHVATLLELITAVWLELLIKFGFYYILDYFFVFFLNL